MVAGADIGHRVRVAIEHLGVVVRGCLQTHRSNPIRILPPQACCTALPRPEDTPTIAYRVDPAPFQPLRSRYGCCSSIQNVAHAAVRESPERTAAISSTETSKQGG